jgi:hypothetical protein
VSVPGSPGICLVVRAEFFFRYATARQPNESLLLRLQMAEVHQRHRQRYRTQSQAGNADGAVCCTSRQRQVQEERSKIDRRAREEHLIALMDEEGQDLEELEAVDSANLIRDLAVDPERVLSDRTDAHMIMFLKNVENSV